MAEARLTPQQSRGAQNTERTPSGKGKSIDPGNWGAANLNEDDINLDVQKQIYKSLQKPDILNNWQCFLKWQEDENNRTAVIKIARDLEVQNAHKQPSVKIEETLDEPTLSSSCQAKTEALSETMADHIVNLTSTARGCCSNSVMPEQAHTDRPSDFIAQDSRLAKTIFGSLTAEQSQHVTEPWNQGALNVEGWNPLYKINKTYPSN
ncbi:hypothetical protein GYMLUDRAFT_60506 [Collybiopsis luxurians FD-317 M1]|uniref:Uncharacterized protein n=1 Tax=Collybiopsis luxurians FD-317 M1 TaxID=944289 RepID=A0A0D0BTI4_9AGAR|nr:hypothetical protein GYMLUDRAFT_60506 [Collybiopsis luxurians FD-317 M1]